MWYVWPLFIVAIVVFLWMQRHQQHMHIVLLWDSTSFWTQRLALIQILSKGPLVAAALLEENLYILFLFSNWSLIKACSSVDECDLISCHAISVAFQTIRHYVACQLKMHFIFRFEIAFLPVSLLFIVKKRFPDHKLHLYSTPCTDYGSSPIFVIFCDDLQMCIAKWNVSWASGLIFGTFLLTFYLEPEPCKPGYLDHSSMKVWLEKETEE